MNSEFIVEVRKTIIETYIVDAEDKETAELLWNSGDGYMDNVEEINAEIINVENLEEEWL